MPGMPSRVGGIYGSLPGPAIYVSRRDYRWRSSGTWRLGSDSIVQPARESPQLYLLNEWQNAIRIVNCRLNIVVK